MLQYSTIKSRACPLKCWAYDPTESDRRERRTGRFGELLEAVSVPDRELLHCASESGSMAVTPERQLRASAFHHTRHPKPRCRFIEASQAHIVFNFADGCFYLHELRYPVGPPCLLVPKESRSTKKYREHPIS